MFTVRYRNLKIVPSKSAMEELMNEGKTLTDVKEILEGGYKIRKRRKDCIEKGLDKGRKTYNAVIVKDYSRHLNEEVWLLTHFGKFTKNKKR